MIVFVLLQEMLVLQLHLLKKLKLKVAKNFNKTGVLKQNHQLNDDIRLSLFLYVQHTACKKGVNVE